MVAADASFLTILLETSPFFFSQLTALTDLTPASYVEQVRLGRAALCRRVMSGGGTATPLPLQLRLPCHQRILSRKAPTGLRTVQVLAFVNVYLMLNDANQLAVFSVGTTGW